MMKVFMEGSHAVAEAVKRIKPGVVCAYPITPQTHIVERLSEMVSDGDLAAEFINVESEHSAASVVLGSTATGVRSFTATSSQGLILMSEVLFNIAGMRLPVVLTCVNRALSAPINIWNDHQDSMTVRDAGWMQLYAENNQECHDLHYVAYKLAENKDVMLPCMVCMDGYILSHGYETLELLEQDKADKFLPAYDAAYKLDTENPLTMGLLGAPDVYMETRYAIHKTMEEVLALLPEVEKEFEQVAGRKTPLIIEKYKTGLKDGFSFSWYENGQIRQEFYYLKGNKHGICQTWYKNGQKQMQGNFAYGRLNGTFKGWDEAGFLIFDLNYSDDTRRETSEIEEEIDGDTKDNSNE